MSEFVELGLGRTLMLYGEQNGPYASGLLINPYAKKGQGSAMWSLKDDIAPRVAPKEFFHMEKVEIVRGKPLFKTHCCLRRSGYVEARTVTHDISSDST